MSKLALQDPMMLEIKQKEEKKRLEAERRKKLIEQDLKDLLCPLFDNGFCMAAQHQTRCYNPREYESCPWWTGRWDGL